MTASRRHVLRTLAVGGTGSALALAGCVNPAPTDDSTAADPTTGGAADDASPTPDSSPTATPTTEPEPTTRTATADAQRGPLRPDGDPVSVERTVTDPELDYLPATDAVKYPAYYERTGRGPDGQPTRTAIYETTPFEDWGETECASASADRVQAVAADRIDGDPKLSVGITKREGKMAVTAQQTTTRNREGTVVSEPTTAFERVVAAVPRSVDATIHFEGQTHATTVPVWVSEMTIQYA